LRLCASLKRIPPHTAHAQKLDVSRAMELIVAGYVRLKLELKPKGNKSVERSRDGR
jgi:hypothetical protein